MGAAGEAGRNRVRRIPHRACPSSVGRRAVGLSVVGRSDGGGSDLCGLESFGPKSTRDHCGLSLRGLASWVSGFGRWLCRFFSYVVSIDDDIARMLWKCRQGDGHATMSTL